MGVEPCKKKKKEAVLKIPVVRPEREKKVQERPEYISGRPGGGGKRKMIIGARRNAQAKGAKKKRYY